MAIDLIRKNETRNFIIAEQSSEIGGTWNDNRYPGCAADGKSSGIELGSMMSKYT